MKKSKWIALALVFACSGLGCLKTRAQLRDSNSDPEDYAPVAVKPAQDVRVHGQYVIDELKTEMTRIEGRLEDLERGQKEAAHASNSREREELKQLDARIAQLEQSQTALAQSVQQLETNLASVQASAKEASVQKSPKDSAELFKKGKAHFAKGEYKTAIETFGHYLKTPKPKLAQEATFLMGESLFKLKEYKKAIVEYSKFPEKFSKSNFMPEALLKIGMAFDALGMKEDARGFYQELLDRFPTSPLAKKAKQHLK